MNMSQLYEKDFYQWTVETVNALRGGKMNELDVDNLIEEIEDMGASQTRQLGSRLEVLIMHLLKWQYQPDLQGKSWVVTIKEQRLRIKKLLKNMPSLKAKLSNEIQEAYSYAIIKAENETGLPSTTFPETLPYTQEQILDDKFYPNQ